MNQKSKAFDSLFAPMSDARFRKGAIRGSVALSIAVISDIFTSMIMMETKGPNYEANIAFRQLYNHPSASNLLYFIQDQLYFIIPIVLGLLAPFVTQHISMPDNVRHYTGYFGFLLRLVLTGFAGLRIYGMYMNILATLIDLPFGYVAPVLIFADALFYLLKYSLASDFKVSNDV